jgi:DNA-binding HxlR family transcriptional regulator
MNEYRYLLVSANLWQVRTKRLVMKQSNNQSPSGQGTLSSRMARGNLFAQDCPSREVLRHVTSRWGVLVLIALKGGTHRFSDLRRKVAGVSEKMLAQTLQWLEADRLVLRVSYPVVPPHVEYSLTPLGQDVALKVEDLADWIEANLSQVLHGQSPD